MKRVAVVGSSGSGKTTLSRRLARQLDLPHLELDSIYHQENWEPLPVEEFRQVVEAFVGRDRWIIDGNYPHVSDLVWERADTILWIDLPRWRVMRRLVGRTASRGLRGTLLWNGNRERLGNMFSRDPEVNLVVWAWTRHRGLRERYEQRTAEFDNGDVYRLKKPSHVRRFGAGLGF